ncbi:MAG: DEAD/DEAH box helicase family protein [Deltaproteobacteria bacterium]|nr:DEAD/DEAH box helicase family protein [Deltaproteobacteria bacterium]
MKFKELELKGTYDSRVDDVYNDFFNKVLSSSRLCRRVGGVFTSRNFAACAEGMQEFIKNDGKMQLVLAQTFLPEDADAICRGYAGLEDQITKAWITNFDTIKDKFIENHTRALSWLLKNNLLEIKIVVLCDQDGRPLDNEKLNRVSELKRKIGIFRGQEAEEYVSFSGNIDFDDPILGDAYHFDVYRYWDDSERERVNNHNTEFMRYWDGTTTKIDNSHVLKTIELPMAIREHLIKKSPRTKNEIKLASIPKLRTYQEKAVNRWIKNNGRGVLEMATGSGKTITAMCAMLELSKQNDSTLVIIVVPYNTIAEQWKLRLTNMDITVITTLGNNNWVREVSDGVQLLNSNGRIGIKVIITSYSSYYKEKFVSLTQECRVPIILIADEVHHAGSFEQQKGLLQNYQYRLGLTATLQRHYDVIGTEALKNYFGGIVFSYDLGQAISDGILAKYKYHLHSVELTTEEYKRYNKETRYIGMLANSKDEDRHEKIEFAKIRRSHIIRDAQNKINKFEEIIAADPLLKHTLIFCSEKQINYVQNILLKANPPIKSRRIIANDPKNPNERMKIIQELVKENYDAVVAIDVLDEGMDAPEIKNCIMLSSSGNPKQFIQRRGRILRKFFGKYKDGSTKEFATIHDIMITPQIDDAHSLITKKTEASILGSQISRLSDIAKLAINADECFIVINQQKNLISGFLD